KVRELEGESSDPKEIDSLRLELERVKEDLNSKNHEIECWISDDLRPLVYERGLEDKVMKLDKEYAKEDILEALQELLPRDGMVSRSQTDTLPNQSIHSQPAHSEKSILREGVAKQLGGAEVVPLSQKMPLAPVTVPVITSSLMGSLFRDPMSYAILALFLIIIWIVGKKIWNSWSTNPREKNINKEQIPAEGTQDKGSHRPDIYYLKS
ncbi:hypothetical protein C1645_739850, partial [Glomus cerebriforme]